MPGEIQVLLIEDEHGIARSIIEEFARREMVVHHVVDGFSGLHALKAQTFDLVILDLMVPIIDGESVLRAVRESGSKVPVIVLTARSDLGTRLSAFDLGADDYLSKPFFVEELVVRARALHLRSLGVEPSVLAEAGLTLDKQTRELTFKGRSCVLSQREYMLLEYLMRSPNRVFTKKQIIGFVWKFDFDPTTNIVEVCVQRIRRKIASLDSTTDMSAAIQNVRGVGYKFVAPLQPAQTSAA